MNLQQIFDKSASHLLKQGEKSWLVNRFACAYRSEGGLMCAVGCLIDDSAYSPELEGTAIDHSPNVQRALRHSGIEFDTDGQVMLLLTRLQWVHDIKDAHDWPEFLSKTANEFKLNRSVVAL
jgi:hypothetical protein